MNPIVGHRARVLASFGAVLCMASTCWAQGAIAPPALAANALEVIADVDCDGKPDKVVVRQGAREVRVEVTFGGRRRKPASFTFLVSSGVEAGVCSIPVRLAIESLDYDPSDAVGRVRGFARSRTCKGFVLDDDRCDPVHFFWNVETKRLDWWRA